MKCTVVDLWSLLFAIALFAGLPTFTLGQQAKNASATKKKVVFVAGRPSHRYGDHEHNAGCRLLAGRLQQAMPNVTCDVHYNGWPADANAFDGADCIVMYCDGGARHMVNEHLDQVDVLANKGVGIVCIHYAVEVPKGEIGDKFLEWIGGYFEMNWSVNPHWTAKFDKLPTHPITRGVQPFEIHDEWYYHMRFRARMNGVTPILTAMPTPDSLSRPDGPHSGNAQVRAAVLERKEPQHVAWATEREGGGRGFGFTGGHYHWNWGDPNFRKLMLNAIVWCAHGEVPTGGVESPSVALKELEANLDPKPIPKEFDREAIRQRLKLPPDDAGAKASPAGPAKVGAAGPAAPEVTTTSAAAAARRALQAPTRLSLLRNETVQKALDLVPQQLTALQKLQQDATAAAAGGDDPQRQATAAVTGLDVAEGLQATLFASEPEISNITNIDIDHLGRVWACEVMNYRWEKRRLAGPPRPEGDRILVLEDTNGDGKSDKQTVFYQGTDIDSVHGVCVLGSRIIVSALDKVTVFYDENGDLKADEKRDVLFSGIGGVQHDHGIHAFVFGPDGKLYFNFGNSGEHLKDASGKIIVDQAGNEIAARRKPYQEGMVFRCNLDGSQVETLGWNFRNNWEVAVDSFGTLWQSDNDDDGNRGVRINYVMEFGNYGYKDELTGAAWKAPRENLEKEIPEQHWHLNDPGVVPTLLLTGAGSPTGICVYEGRLLPKVFWDQVLHCDAGPNVVRAYVTTKDGAGYKAEMVNILDGSQRDNWFRPSDVCVAPDGSLFIADWYDPGVGGHNQQDVERGRIFRVAPPASKYTPPKFDFATAAGCLAALENPCQSVRYLAFTSLVALGEKAHHPLEELIEKTDNARLKARALWVLARLPGEGEEAVEMALADKNPDVRIAGIRIARQLGMDVKELARQAHDPAPEVRRELAIALRHSKSPQAPQLWAELAMQHDGRDRWYLEALGIAADKQWDACLDAYLAKASDPWKTPAGRDILWRSRAKKTPELLAKIIKDPATKEQDQPRYFRALDFLSGPEKEAALKSLLE
jgi:putative membrane-bound dehydrogenase-like protein